jgi:ppGpp synthetase/RelA/SpoT-type nucleotidyltranferase
MMEIGEERYIGDGIYAGYDGYHVVLKTGSADNIVSAIYLDVQVRNALRELLAEFDNKEDENV